MLCLARRLRLRSYGLGRGGLDCGHSARRVIRQLPPSSTAALGAVRHATYKHTGRAMESDLRKDEQAAYRMLDVSPDSSEVQIKSQFRKLAMLHHPDTTASARGSASSTTM